MTLLNCRAFSVAELIASLPDKNPERSSAPGRFFLRVFA